MKILVVCQYYAPEPFRIPDICQALARKGHSVTVVTGTPNYPEGEIYPGYEKGQHRDELLEGVRVHRCSLVPRKHGTVYRFLNYYSFVFSARSYLRGLKEDFDVVLVNQLSPVMMALPALSWAKRHHKKCVLYCLDLWPESLLAGGIRRGSPIYRYFLGVSQRIYSRADRILVSSYGFLQYFRDTLELDGASLRYLPQYAEELFGENAQPVPGGEGMNFVFAGNVGTTQSVETLVEAAGLVKDRKDIHIHIVGGGISLDRCRELAKGLDNITFYGRRPLSEMPGFYAMADVMLVTLLKDPVLSVTLPGKVQSYMAAGKPILGAIDGEAARVVREARCGICVGAQDSAALAQAMISAAQAPETWKAWGKNARDYYERNFRKEKFISDLEAELKDTI